MLVILKEAKLIGELTSKSGELIGISLKSVKKAIKNHVVKRINFLETALKYTNKTTSKNKIKKQLIYLNVKLNEMNMYDKMDEYLNSVNEFAKTGTK